MTREGYQKQRHGWTNMDYRRSGPFQKAFIHIFQSTHFVNYSTHKKALQSRMHATLQIREISQSALLNYDQSEKTAGTQYIYCVFSLILDRHILVPSDLISLTMSHLSGHDDPHGNGLLINQMWNHNVTSRYGSVWKLRSDSFVIIWQCCLPKDSWSTSSQCELRECT